MSELLDLRMRMARLDGVESRLEYLKQNCDPEALAVAEEYVRLSRLRDYAEPPDGRRWASQTHAAIAKRLVDAILRDVFQGKKDHLRDHMLGVAARTDRQLVTEPWWEMRLRAATAEAWNQGAAAEVGATNPYEEDQ